MITTPPRGIHDVLGLLCVRLVMPCLDVVSCVFHVFSASWDVQCIFWFVCCLVMWLCFDVLFPPRGIRERGRSPFARAQLHLTAAPHPATGVEIESVETEPCPALQRSGAGR